MSNLKLISRELELPIILSEEYVRLLIIENPTLFYNIVSQLNSQINGGSGSFVLFSDNQEISVESNGELIYDYYNFDFNDKKLLSLLYKTIEKEVASYHIEKIHQANTYLNCLMMDILEDLPFAFSLDDITTNALLKALAVKFEVDYETLEEKIICLINILIELKKCKFIIFVNLKSILSDEQLLHIYHHCNLEKICLLLIENSQLRTKLSMEKALIVTEDRCEIVDSYPNV